MASRKYLRDYILVLSFSKYKYKLTKRKKYGSIYGRYPTPTQNDGCWNDGL